MTELSAESVERIALVRRNELSMESLTGAELDGLEVALKTPMEERKAEETPAADSSATEDGGSDERTASADTLEPRPKTRQDLANEANTLRQRLESLPKKLKNNPAFREEFIRQNGLEEYLAIPKPAESDLDLSDPHMSRTEKLLAEQLLALQSKEKDRERIEANRELTESLFGEIDNLVATNPELAPKSGSWRSLNTQLAKAYEIAGNDSNKLNDPTFVAELADRGVVVPTDANFIRLVEIHKIKQEMGIGAEDAYFIWKGRNPSLAKTASVPAVAVVAEPDRATALLGTNATAQGKAAPMSYIDQVSRFYAKCGSRMDRLSVTEEAEWTAILASEPKSK